jgi:membrane-associated phospholipid phosphatase
MDLRGSSAAATPRLAAALVAGVALLAVRAAAGGVPGIADRSALRWALDHRGPDALAVARFVTDTGASPLLFPLVVLAGLAVRLRTGRWQPALVALAVAGAGVAARFGLSTLIREPRPPIEVRAVAVSGFSFPSGHATTSALIAGTLAWLLSLLLPARWMRVTAAAVLGAWALGVALTRVYLGVHWVGDILGSWLFAAALLTLLPAGARTGPAGRAGTATGPEAECPR